MDYRVHGNIQSDYWNGGDLPNPVMYLRSPVFPVDSLSSEPQRKPKNTEVGRLSLLQQIFQTQESNWGLLHCRQILYQLSYEVSPLYPYTCVKKKKKSKKKYFIL